MHDRLRQPTLDEVEEVVAGSHNHTSEAESKVKNIPNVAQLHSPDSSLDCNWELELERNKLYIIV